MTDTPESIETNAGNNEESRRIELWPDNPIPSYNLILYLAVVMIIFGVSGIIIGVLFIMGSFVDARGNPFLVGFGFISSGFFMLGFSSVLYAVRDTARNSFYLLLNRK